MMIDVKNKRLDVVDALRGFAVMAILILHAIEHFNFMSYPDTSNQSVWLNFTDKAIWDSLFFAFGGKAYAIFALLFGFSFYIQDSRQLAQGEDFRLRFCWRLILLFAIGNLNAAFFTAEVLVLYSIVGFILPVVCRLSDKTLLIIASILLIQPLPLFYTIASLFDAEFVAPLIPTRSLWGATRIAQQSCNFIDITLANLKEGQLASLAWAFDHGRFFQTGALLIFGYLIGRRGLFAEGNTRFWCKTAVIAAICFFPIYGLVNMVGDYITHKQTLTPLLLILRSWSNFAFMLMILSTFIVTFYHTSLKGLLGKLIPYGRMSLTNYIVQSIFGALIFYNWGFAMAGKLTITASFFVGIAMFIVQYYSCKLWLKHFKQGPLENLWGRATWFKF